MSLDYNLEKCRNLSDIMVNHEFHIEPLSKLTIALGINDIQDKVTANKFRKRYIELGVVQGLPVQGLLKELPQETIDRFIGMRTNASQISDAAWKKRLARIVQDVVKDALEKERKDNQYNEKGE